MSVIIKHIQRDEERSYEVETPFEIYSSDSLMSIKNRFLIEKGIYPPIAKFEIVSKPDNEIIESKDFRIFRFQENKNNILSVDIKTDIEWKINPLENSIINVISFRDLLDKYEIVEYDEKQFKYSLSKLAIKCEDLFGIKDITEVLFIYIMTMYSTEEEETYEESYERIDPSTQFGLYKELEKYKNKYEEYFDKIKKEYDIDEITNNELYREKYEDFIKDISKLNLSSLKEKGIQTSITEVNYLYKGQCKMAIDLYELFNLLYPDTFLQFAYIGKFYKVLNNFKYPEEWSILFNEEDESVLRFYIFGKENDNDINIENPNSDDYFMVELMQVDENKGVFSYEISIKANNQIQISEDKIIERALNYLIVRSQEIIKPYDISLKKTFGNGFFVYKNVDLFRELFFDFCTNHPYMRGIIVFDEKYKIEKERGGTRFFITLNNLETYTKCSLYFKKIDKPYEKEVEAYPDIVNVGDKIILINILYGESEFQVNKAIKLLNSCITYMLLNIDNFFYSYYSKYISNIRSIKNISFEDEKEMRLKDIYPQMFVSGYGRFCQQQPKIIFDEEEIKKKQKEKSDLFLFPKTKKEGPQSYYSCSHNNRYPFVGLSKNTLPNSDQYPYLPCCFAKDQNVKNKLRFIYESDFTVEKEEGVRKQVIKSKKVLKEGQFGILPNNLLNVFNLVDEEVIVGRNRFLRMGVQQSINSCLIALLKAKDEDTSFENVEKWRKKILNFSNYNFASQRGLEPEYVRNIILKNENIDPMVFIDILENIFGVNIILFCVDRKLYRDGTICSYKFKRNFILNTGRNAYDKTVFLYRTMGGELDGLKYPHCELVVEEKKMKELEKIEGEIITSFDPNSEVVKQIYSIYLTTLNINYKKISFNNKLLGQIEDGYGKIRTLIFEWEKRPFNILVSPSPNFNKEQFNLIKKEIYITDYNISSVDLYSALRFLESEGVNASSIQKITEENQNVIALYCNIGSSPNKKDNVSIYIPVKVNPEEYLTDKSKLLNIRNFDINNNEYPYPNSVSFSLLKQYNSYKRLSNFVSAYCLYLLSHLYNDELRVLRFISTTDTFEEKIRDLINLFERNIIINEDIEYNVNRNLNLENNTIIEDNDYLIVSSETIKKKLLYIAYINIKYNIEETIEYMYKKYVKDFYTTSKDFNVSEHFTVFFTTTELNFTKTNKNKYTVYSIPPTLKDNTIFFKNQSVLDGAMCILQKCNSIESALYVSMEWNKTKINKWNYNGVVDKDSVNYTLYTYEGRDSKTEDEYIENVISNISDLNFYNILIHKFENVKNPAIYAVLEY
jgi:hypothetical protein